ncbi:PilW family protein [Meiothermus rufus]|uniref:PilW family protein n=1 Tax=Meiothermus rufus TaxID=604332 RepID=UPI000401CF48|nr:type II secretion system protein [Meiothermus rufus]
MGRWGFSLVEMTVALAVAGLLVLAAGSLLAWGGSSLQEAELLEAQVFHTDLRERLGKDIRTARQVALLTSTELRLAQPGACVQYRLLAGTLQERRWSGGCGLPAGSSLAWEPFLFPTAGFCALAGGVAFLDTPCPAGGLEGSQLSLQKQGSPNSHSLPAIFARLR